MLRTLCKVKVPLLTARMQSCELPVKSRLFLEQRHDPSVCCAWSMTWPACLLCEKLKTSLRCLRPNSCPRDSFGPLRYQMSRFTKSRSCTFCYQRFPFASEDAFRWRAVLRILGWSPRLATSLLNESIFWRFFYLKMLPCDWLPALVVLMLLLLMLLRTGFLSTATPSHLEGICGPGAPHVFEFVRRRDTGKAKQNLP